MILIFVTSDRGPITNSGEISYLLASNNPLVNTFLDTLMDISTG